ncbi:hypothetical protein [Pelosinus sp. IPA-1]|uniref:hypothetical protein n=1 Tax=Pelosinus sp. IPA-1 TaxID=3029569 RepID=UPI00243625EB|nr:hypothetical protein [Pelosinus sp. IPA-1]GMB02082.1 hypothetical protein PIPA1_48820 [Pelosinus sp. IPA-1]
MTLRVIVDKNIKKNNSAKTKIINSKKQKEKDFRLMQIREACEKLVEEGIQVTYTAVSDITAIPKRTLEHSYYSVIITRYRSGSEVGIKTSSKEVELWKNEADYWKQIANKYKLALKEVTTLLVEKGISLREER